MLLFGVLRLKFRSIAIHAFNKWIDAWSVVARWSFRADPRIAVVTAPTDAGWTGPAILRPLIVGRLVDSPVGAFTGIASLSLLTNEQFV